MNLIIRTSELLLGTLLISLAGCAGLPGTGGNGATITTYTLEPALTTVPIHPDAWPCLTVVVSPPRSAPGFATNRMAYTEAPPRIDYFATHQWADTPARMLLDDIVDALRRTQAFGGVVSAPSPANAQIQIETKVRSLSQDFAQGGSEERLQLDVNIVDVRDGRLLGEQTLSAARPAAPNPQSGAIAANQAAAEVLAKLDRFTLASLTQAGISCR